MLYDVIEAAKAHKEKECIALIDKFFPLIKKYSKKLAYEDAEQDLLCYFVELIYSFPLEKFGKKDEGKIVNYIAKCLYHDYIHLLKVVIESKKTIVFSDLQDAQLYIIEVNGAKEDDYERLFIGDLKSILNEKEWGILEKIYLKGHSVAQVAAQEGVPRQAVNQMKNRILEKSRKYFDK